VRYGETDQMGYLYYGNYCLLYEIGRVEAFRELGLRYKYLEDELKIMMPVISVESRYIKPAKYDDLLSIKTILKTLPGKIIHYFFEIFNQDNELLHRAEVKLCFVDMITNQMVKPPHYITDKLGNYFDQED
jgi:acyl-CoA thioester hydrolase